MEDPGGHEYAGALADILAYLLQANGYPSGNDELTVGIAGTLAACPH